MIAKGDPDPDERGNGHRKPGPQHAADEEWSRRSPGQGEDRTRRGRQGREHERNLGDEAVELAQRDPPLPARRLLGCRIVRLVKPVSAPGPKDRKARQSHQVGSLGQVALPDAVEDAGDLRFDDTVIDPWTIPARRDHVLGAKDRQLLADDRLVGLQLLLQIGDIPFADLEQLQDPKPQRVTEDPDHSCRTFEDERVDAGRAKGRRFHACLP
jgi:hypothetical protein